MPPVLAPRFIFVSRPVSLYTVIKQVKSRFRKDRTKRDEHLLKCCKLYQTFKRIVWSLHSVIDVQIFISKSNERLSLGLLFEQQGLKLTQIHHEIIESLINGTDTPAANRRTLTEKQQILM